MDFATFWSVFIGVLSYFTAGELSQLRAAIDQQLSANYAIGGAASEPSRDRPQIAPLVIPGDADDDATTHDVLWYTTQTPSRLERSVATPLGVTVHVVSARAFRDSVSFVARPPVSGSAVRAPPSATADHWPPVVVVDPASPAATPVFPTRIDTPLSSSTAASLPDGFVLPFISPRPLTDLSFWQVNTAPPVSASLASPHLYFVEASCVICTRDGQMLLRKVKCCRQLIHVDCLSQCLLRDARCPFCRASFERMI